MAEEKISCLYLHPYKFSWQPLIEQLKPDILVSDIGMPDMDGYMLLSKIREMQPEIGGNIPAIALTAYAGEIEGFQRHVTKPIEPDNLISTVIEVTTKTV